MRRKWLPSQQKQMPTFIQRQPERLSETFQHLRGGMHITTLLQLDIPGGADIGKLCDLLTPQPWRPLADTRWQSYISGGKVRAPRA